MQSLFSITKFSNIFSLNGQCNMDLLYKIAIMNMLFMHSNYSNLFNKWEVKLMKSHLNTRNLFKLCKVRFTNITCQYLISKYVQMKMSLIN